MPTKTRTEQTATDPLSRAIAISPLMLGRRPVPLVAATFDIAIAGGLADVIVARTFRNDEPNSIEATLTFPLPVQAVLRERSHEDAQLLSVRDALLASRSPAAAPDSSPR